jgi:hypothetical protein
LTYVIWMKSLEGEFLVEMKSHVCSNKLTFFSFLFIHFCHHVHMENITKQQCCRCGRWFVWILHERWMGYPWGASSKVSEREDFIQSIADLDDEIYTSKIYCFRNEKFYTCCDEPYLDISKFEKVIFFHCLFHSGFKNVSVYLFNFLTFFLYFLFFYCNNFKLSKIAFNITMRRKTLFYTGELEN